MNSTRRIEAYPKNTCWSRAGEGKANNNRKFIKYIALAHKSRLRFKMREIWKFYSFIIVCIFNLIYENDFPTAPLNSQSPRCRFQNKNFLNYQTE